ncbi:neutral/alkaline non-lysosomal ceramidase N-terminal domain-containing protein [Gracilibacillus alcaliphilus]|uniref:neutral/alkaline non-lysosomal ceramidase N-terminal domain-containing protein n=1 Tax=Gracilibacillus alcaliphilus TaxID=1401441 RepID=UPI001957BA3F|nr:neutral/alkaline non-lysosomal ceramidase N-terminal domain-containing protein [Gracilibacillus alcaliphilus]MBM7679510.1 hypothetical protein [Gracilibacillus alcaliphilus]
MQLGVSKIDITPDVPIEIAGFAHRQGAAETVYSPLWLKISYFQGETTSFVLIAADLIWWDDQWVMQLKKQIADLYQLAEHQICFHATHSHSGPQTSDKFSVKLGRRDRHYLGQLQESVLQGIAEAKQDIEEVLFAKQTASCKLGINRRRFIDQQIVMAPNSNGSTDDTISVISFQTVHGKKKAIWLHYSCHPTVTDANQVSGEFCGAACAEIEQIYPSAVVGYLQGFCGDIRPNLVESQTFIRGTVEDMDQFGAAFALAALQLLEQSVQFVPLAAEVKVIEVDINVPLDYTTDPQPPDELAKEWRELVKHYREDTMKLQYIRIAEELQLFTCNGELVHAYGLFLREIDSNILPLGYANGMIGYVPTAEQITEGGYESYDSIFYFGLPYPFSPTIEELMKRKMKELYDQEKENVT